MKRERDDSQSALCEMCGTTDGKYRCPKCEMRTCSVKCCQDHKKDKNCDGKRVRTEFVGIKEFSDKTLKNDVKFLEEIERETDNAKRGLRKYGQDVNDKEEEKKKMKKGSNKRSMFQRLPPKLKSLVKQAEDRGVDLLLMPLGMSKRAENTTYYDRKEGKVFWHVELKFVNKEKPVVLEKIAEDVTLNELARHQGSMECTSFEIANYNKEAKFVADGTVTIRDALQGCTIAEYPTITCKY